MAIDFTKDGASFGDLLFPGKKLKINAAIVRHDKRVFCIYRTDHLDNFDSDNYISELDNNLNPISHKRLITENGNTAFEDIRLFSFNNRLIALYTCFQKTEANSWDRIYKMEIGLVNVDSGVISNQQSLKLFSKRFHEKNWVPYAYKGIFYIITDLEPELRIIKLVGEIGNFTVKEYYTSTEKTDGWDYGEIRGGTPFFKDDASIEEWNYSFVHSSLFLPNGNTLSRFYFYTVLRFHPISKKIEYYKNPLGYSLWSNEDKKYMSSIITTRDPTIRVVFPMGIMIWEDGLVLSYGKDDLTSQLMFYTWLQIKNLFNDQ